MNAFLQLRRAANGVCASIERGWGRHFSRPLYLLERYELEPLEKRQLLSVAAHITGPAEVTEGDAYVLSLSASSTASTYTVQNWSISYGDGGSHMLFGDSVADLYTYNTASSPTDEITATVYDTEGTLSYSGSTSMAVTVDEANAQLSLTPDPTAVFGQPFVVTESLADGGEHTLSGYSIAWGDGSSDSDSTTPESITGTYADTLTHTYASTGTYDVTASAVTEQGTATATTAIVAAPQFYAEDDGNGYTVGSAYDLTPSFTDPGHTLGSYVVSWGDGSTDDTYSASATDFSHDYTADSANPYQATITAAADDGTWTAADDLSVAPPTLSLSAPGTATQGATYTIDAEVSSGETAGSNYNFSVDWGDGAGEQDVSAPSGPLSYTYAAPGTYSLSVEVDGDGGEGDFAEATVAVAVATPTVAVSYPNATLTAGVGETFTDSYSNPGGDALDNLTVAWGDGDTDAYYLDPQQEAHTYAHPGTYTVTDTFVTDDATYTASTSADVIDGGTLNVTGSNQAIEGEAYTLYASLAEPDGQTPTSYSISWGDGHNDQYEADSQGTFTHTYTELNSDPGYSISAAATTVDGTFSAAATDGVTVVPPYGNLYGSSVEAVQGGEPFEVVMFWDDGSGGYFPGYPVSGHIVTYSVNWGDGSSDTYIGDNTLAHAYSYYPTPTGSETDSPQFTVIATTDEGLIGLPGGGHATFTGGVAVYTPGGSATINASFPSSAVEGDDASGSATFTDSTQGPDDAEHGANHWEIIWGDGNSSGSNQSVNPSFTYDHTYTTAGEYTPTLTAEYLEESAPDWDGQGPYVIQTLLSPIDISVASLTVTAVGDTTATVVGDTYSLSLGFSHNPALGNEHVPLYYTVAWGDGATDDYYADQYGDLPSAPTHVYAIASTGGSNYSVDVTAYTDEGTYTAVTQPSVIVAQPEMQVIENDGSTLDASDQHSMGAFVIDDPNDQQTSLSSADPEMLQVDLLALPSSVGGTYSLSISGNITAWADPYRDQQVSSGQTYDATTAQTLWVQGTGISSQTGVDGLALDWEGPLGELIDNVDYAHVSAIGITGPENVPADGIYTYDVFGAVAQPANATPWTVTGGNKITQSPAGNVCTILWNSPPAGTAANAGWFGTVQFTTVNGVNVGPVSINVVQIVIAAPPASFAPAGGKSFIPGTPADNADGVVNGVDRKSVKSGDQNANFGLEYFAQVTLNGPIKAGVMLGVRDITVGFVQDKTGYTNQGTYANGVRTSTLEAAYAKGPMLDAPADGQVWYDPNTIFTGGAPPNNTTIMESKDSPKDGPPMGWLMKNQVQAGEPPLLSMTLKDQFALFICAQTSDNQNHASQVYVERASATWVFTGTGGVHNGIWQGPGSVTAPTSWTSVTNGSVPVITAKTANDLSQHVERFK